jgi:hypothetical protein
MIVAWRFIAKGGHHKGNRLVGCGVIVWPTARVVEGLF